MILELQELFKSLWNKGYLGNEMKKIFETNVEIIGTNKIHLESVNIETQVKLEETVVISDPEKLSKAFSLIHFPLEEYEYGMYKDNITLKDIVDMAIGQSN